MARTRKPTVTTNCVADRYTMPHEKIVEFSSGDKGGLISFSQKENGELHVHLYRCSLGVTVTFDEPKLID